MTRHAWRWLAGAVAALAAVGCSTAGSTGGATPAPAPTPTAAVTPMVVRKGMPATARPDSAIITVRPAKTTAEPAVPTARPAASCRSWPSAISER